jgi:glutathione S-transferase
MIKLFQFAPAFDLPNASPFCLKLETYLRMTSQQFEIPVASMSDVTKAPKGKMPYIEDNGKTIADSSIIIDYLKTTYGDTLDGWMTDQETAVALAFQRMIEENLYWTVVHSRWIAAEGWHKTKVEFFRTLPAPLKLFVPALSRRGLMKSMKGHGMGRHSESEIYEIGKKDVTAIAVFLGNKAYFMGDRPSSIDATVFGFIANLVVAPVESALKEHALKYPPLLAYCERMKARYFQGKTNEKSHAV